MRAGKGSAGTGLAGTTGSRTDAADSRARVLNSPAHPTESAAAGPGSALSTRHASATKNGRKRTATVGSVHDADPVPRTVDEVIADPGRSAAVAAGPPAVRQPGPRPGST